MRSALTRLAGAIPALLGVILFTFVLTRVLPGDTAAYFAGPTASAEAIEQIRHSLGLDRPLPEQFLAYVAALVHGDILRCRCCEASPASAKHGGGAGAVVSPSTASAVPLLIARDGEDQARFNLLGGVNVATVR